MSTSYHSAAEGLARHLSSNGLGTIGGTEDWDLFIDDEPPNRKRVVTLYNVGGSGFWRSMSGGRNEVDLVQVRVRGTTHNEARAKMVEIVNQLDMTRNTTIEGVDYVLIEQVDPPSVLELDTNHAVWITQFRVVRDQ